MFMTLVVALGMTAKEKENVYGCTAVFPEKFPSGTPENPTIVLPPKCGLTSIFGKVGRPTFTTIIDTTDLTKHSIDAAKNIPYMLPEVGNESTKLSITHLPSLDQLFWFGYMMPAGVVSQRPYAIEGIIRTEKLTNSLRRDLEQTAETTIPNDAAYAVRFYHRFPTPRNEQPNWQPIFTITTSEDPSNIPIKAYIQNQGRTLHLQQYDNAGNASLSEFIIGTAEQ